MEQTPAVSSPAEVADPFNGQTPTLDEYLAYRQDGEVPAKFKPAEPAEPAPADPPEETVESEIEPDSEPAEAQEQPRKGSGAEKRIKQLLAEKKELERKLAQGTKPDATSAPSPVTPEQQQIQPTRPEPTLDDPERDEAGRIKYDANGHAIPKYKAYEAFTVALTQWAAEQALHKDRVTREQQAQAERAQKNLEKAAEHAQKSVEKARQLYGDEYDTVIEPAASAIMSDKAIPPAIKGMMAESDVLPELMYTVGGDSKTMDKLVHLARTNPFQAIRYIATLEVGIRQKLDSAKPASEPQTEAPAPKKTMAPKPPAPVTGASSRAFDVSDESLSAEEWMRKRNTDLNRRGKA